MERINAVPAQCPICGEEQEHKVLKGTFSTKGAITFQGTVKCMECGHVHPANIRVDKNIDIQMVVSWMGKAEKRIIDLPPNELVYLDDQFQIEDGMVKVTGIQQGNKRLDSAMAKDIEVLWVTRYDKVRLKFTINKGRRSISKEILVVPEEEFFVGDELDIDKMPVVIVQIQTESGPLRRGSAEATEIKRIYCKTVKQR